MDQNYTYFIFRSIILLSILWSTACIAHDKKLVTEQKHPLLKSILRKNTPTMTFDEAVQAREYYLQEKDTNMAIKCAQRALAVSGDQDKMAEITLDLAQRFLDDGKFDQAQKYALEFQQYYPGTDEAKVATYIEIKANFLSTLSAHHDQTKTRKTIELGKVFLEKHKTDTIYKDSVQDMIDDCYNKLLESEINVINSHISSYKYYKTPERLQAAHHRLTYIKKELASHVQNQEPKLLYVEITLAQAEGKKDIVALKEQELKTKYPSTTLAQATKRIVNKFQ